ncbi:ciliary microtubule inner protein 1 isoform 2-T5 [Liasis olivaceus]
MSQKSKLNFVAEAQIWKDHLETEREAARKWPKRWGFLLTSVEELVKDEKKQPAKPKILLPEHLQIRPVTPVEKYIKSTEHFELCIALKQSHRDGLHGTAVTPSSS